MLRAAGENSLLEYHMIYVYNDETSAPLLLCTSYHTQRPRGCRQRGKAEPLTFQELRATTAVAVDSHVATACPLIDGASYERAASSPLSSLLCVKQALRSAREAGSAKRSRLPEQSSTGKYGIQSNQIACACGQVCS